MGTQGASAEIIEKRASLLRAKRYAAARELELSYLLENPLDADMHYRAGWTAAALKDYDAALEHYHKAAEIKPDKRTLRSLVSLVTRLGDTVAADAVIRAHGLNVSGEKEYLERELLFKQECEATVQLVLDTVLPVWKHAGAGSSEPRFTEIFRKHQSDGDGEWIKYAPKPAAPGAIVDLEGIGRFVVGDPTQVLHKRISRGVPWELPNTILLMELLSRCNPGVVALDVGANVGALTVPMAKALSAGEVIAFEPLAANFSMLVENLKLNNISNVKPLSLACSSFAGRGTLMKPTVNNPGATRLNTQQQGDTLVTTIDAVVLNRPVALMKMDIEGHEPLALKGAQETIRKSRPLILCELLSESRDEIVGILSGYGYSRMRIFRSDWLFYPTEA